MQIKRLLQFAIGVIPILSAEAHGSDAPSASLNKTIKISFNVTGTSLSTDGTQRAYNTLIEQTIYVSSAARMFFRQSAIALQGRGSRQVEMGPNAAGSSIFRFNGNTLVGQMGWAS